MFGMHGYDYVMYIAIPGKWSVKSGSCNSVLADDSWRQVWRVVDTGDHAERLLPWRDSVRGLRHREIFGRTAVAQRRRSLYFKLKRSSLLSTVCVCLASGRNALSLWSLAVDNEKISDGSGWCSLVVVNALGYLQCFHTVGWVSANVLFRDKWRCKPRQNRLTPLHLEKEH